MYHTIMVYAAILCAIGLGMPTRTPPSAMASRATAIYIAEINMLHTYFFHHSIKCYITTTVATGI